MAPNPEPGCCRRLGAGWQRLNTSDFWRRTFDEQQYEQRCGPQFEAKGRSASNGIGNAAERDDTPASASGNRPTTSLFHFGCNRSDQLTDILEPLDLGRLKTHPIFLLGRDNYVDVIERVPFLDVIGRGFPTEDDRVVIKNVVKYFVQPSKNLCFVQGSYPANLMRVDAAVTISIR